MSARTLWEANTWQQTFQRCFRTVTCKTFGSCNITSWHEAAAAVVLSRLLPSINILATETQTSYFTDTKTIISVSNNSPKTLIYKTHPFFRSPFPTDTATVLHSSGWMLKLLEQTKGGVVIVVLMVSAWMFVQKHVYEEEQCAPRSRQIYNWK